MFPNAKCELNYNNLFELVIAVVLSAQTKDERVNEVTKILFKKYGTPSLLSKANQSEIEDIIKPLGMHKMKSKNIIELSKKIDNMGFIPDTLDGLMSLDGVGRKSANVILSEYFKIPRIAVDTHVYRTSHRLGLAKGSVLDVENELMKKFEEKYWYFIHIHLVLLGRYICKAKQPLCDKCLIKDCPSR
jgi:endonuclease-3